jgi:hypothetical protein
MSNMTAPVEPQKSNNHYLQISLNGCLSRAYAGWQPAFNRRTMFLFGAYSATGVWTHPKSKGETNESKNRGLGIPAYGDGSF